MDYALPMEYKHPACKTGLQRGVAITGSTSHEEYVDKEHDRRNALSASVTSDKNKGAAGIPAAPLFHAQAWE
jgi:hypothetical protein